MEFFPSYQLQSYSNHIRTGNRQLLKINIDACNGGDISTRHSGPLTSSPQSIILPPSSSRLKCDQTFQRGEVCSRASVAVWGSRVNCAWWAGDRLWNSGVSVWIQCWCYCRSRATCTPLGNGYRTHINGELSEICICI